MMMMRRWRFNFVLLVDAILLYFLRHKLETEEIKLPYVPTEDQVADVLTKVQVFLLSLIHR